jgi:pyrroline-5-carboxylate reductase
MKKITIIGGGNMGLAYARSMFDADHKASVFILENDPERIQEIKASTSISVGNDPKVLTETEVIFLAVKPQVSSALFQKIKPFLPSQPLVVSIMAGIQIESIQRGLGLDKVVRAMPNLPAKLNKGMTTYVAASSVGTKELETVSFLLKATGRIARVPNEAQLDRSVGISGSGPGFVFYFMEAMEKAAMEMGFPKAQAKSMVAQTFEGAVSLYKESDDSLKTWMDRVSSKGGTTLAGLHYFEDKQVSKEIQNGIQACVSRAIELGKK